MGVADEAQGWALEFGKSAVTGAGTGSLAGLIGAGLHAGGADTARTATCESWTNTPGTISIIPGQSPPPGCDAVVDLPLLGPTSSLAEAAVTYGVAIAVVGFFVALAVLARAHHQKT